MAHWLKDYEGLVELQADYDAALAEWRQLRTSDPEAAYAYRKTVLKPLAQEFSRARDYWREVGEATGDRVGVKVVDFVDDNGNGIDDREEGQP